MSTPVTGKLNGNAIELSADLGSGMTTLRGEIKGDAIGGGNLRRHAVLTDRVTNLQVAASTRAASAMASPPQTSRRCPHG